MRVTYTLTVETDFEETTDDVTFAIEEALRSLGEVGIDLELVQVER